MIAFDTNALVRLLIEDDARQARHVRQIVEHTEADGTPIVILSEVLIETVWVLESVYNCTRSEVAQFLETLQSIPTFSLADAIPVREATRRYKKGGDFADYIIVGKAKSENVDKLISFDKKLQKRFPGFVVQKLENVT